MLKKISLQNISNINLLNNTLIIFIGFLPVILLTGNALINIFVIVIDIIFLITLYDYKNKYSFIKDNHFYLLIFFF